MSGPRVDPTVSLGNILVVLTLIVGGVVAWTVSRERGVYNATAISEVRADSRDLEARVRVLENTISAQTGQLTTIITSQSELRADVKRLLEGQP